MSNRNGYNGGLPGGLAFWTVLVAGIAFIVMYFLSSFVAGVSNVAYIIMRVCSLIAWLLVIIFGWRHCRHIATKIIFIIFALAVLAFGVLIFFGIGLPHITI